MESGKKFPNPVGAIWICGSLGSHRLSVKLNKVTVEGQIVEVKEKHVAIRNSRKVKSSQPDYFLHVYQEYTGANPSPIFETRKHHEFGNLVSEQVEVWGKEKDVKADGGRSAEKIAEANNNRSSLEE